VMDRHFPLEKYEGRRARVLAATTFIEDEI
jgi:hypothetical protein